MWRTLGTHLPSSVAVHIVPHFKGLKKSVFWLFCKLMAKMKNFFFLFPKQFSHKKWLKLKFFIMHSHLHFFFASSWQIHHFGHTTHRSAYSIPDVIKVLCEEPSGRISRHQQQCVQYWLETQQAELQIKFWNFKVSWAI